MYTPLKEKLWAYIIHNNPDLMYRLQDEYNVTRYLEEKVSAVMPTALKLLEQSKPGHVIHELCLEQMTRELRPSRYNYILHLLGEAFKDEYKRLRQSGLLIYEAVNLVDYCGETFNTLAFSESTENDPIIRRAITSKIMEYLNNSKS